ncbi:methionine gamma-lyase [Motiliproteus sp. MSK22-1]|uniref:methionine gamma-lyase n=1 Tax=Motiliproteus sp. MSK22-1 TaxID=1897630 RepID=UPI000977FE8C|nr:methionine gamma-lyase [Motiliproteus sp. MSK22-1]OMH31803.1 methionine gamma-lyase [Motiliproteus sp. MSK22-1]
MPQNNKLAFATRSIHVGYDSKDCEGSLNPPIYMTSTFSFDSAEQGGARFAGEQPGHFYSRISNPTQAILETRLADLEEGEAALACASGMGAITATLWTLVAPGDKVLVDKTVYGCTFAYMEHGLKKFGVEVSYVDCTDLDAVKAAITADTKVLYFETPVNPNMRIMDIAGLSALVKDVNPEIKVIVDNTYCTPALQRPLTLGADLVVHSATKYLGGHGDLIAGAVIGDATTLEQIRLVGLKDMTGAVISPMTAFLILRGLKTLDLRMERHCSNAQQVAEMLESHPAVEQVFFPGLKSDPYHQLASQQMSRFGGMIALELKGGMDAGIKMLNKLKLIKLAVSLGDAETLCEHPASMTHSAYTPEERARHGITEGLVRISIGLEAAEDIIADLEQSLSAATA